jgi:protein-disulfide isomerase
LSVLQLNLGNSAWQYLTGTWHTKINRKGENYVNKLKVITVFILMLLLAAPSAWAASTKEELAELKDEVKTLKEGQDAMQKDLAAIIKLLEQGARGAPAQPGFKPADITISGAPVLGNADAIVTLVEYSDYQCPFCSRHYKQVMPELVKNYVESGKLKYVMRENPIQSIHSKAMGASQAALCAGDQGKYWEMHNIMFDNQKQLAVENLKAYSVELGLDTATFDSCLDEGKYEKRVNDDLASGKALGVRGTPAFVLGLTDPDDPNKANVTQFINGAQSLDTFNRTIEDLLKKAEEGQEES